MPAIVPNADVESTLRRLLAEDGFILSPMRGHGETGVDIIAERLGDRWYIECIGYKRSPPARAKDFYESFFRAISRLNEDAVHVVIALASRAERGLPQRAKHHAIAWQRIGQAFPELEIWLVDPTQNTYRRCSWLEWLKS